ncbi:hypothetical protein NZD89_05290 [Alicyclobacillus fastidiosus]|uniref:Uncharacterized protein n=1 Tax=Alicyclobacillus fastidiosus TaxID=392011 RepID=A0ABY6ZIT9_9BACL|nr:hypothetical protein [Alicyclobacillus fastidiosus]WAH42844.1 hypothetical protein NZD89_05290 [Alicyclobacillus fastidiosus]GMA64777.1 hypothetical protein GCM10025859_52170 [Alicyclobacillus fastidiosus]
MAAYSFYPTHVDASTHRYPTYTLIEAGTDQEAIHKLAVEHEMRVAELEPDGVWMEMKDGALVRYAVTRR